MKRADKIPIHFFLEDIFVPFTQKPALRKWIISTIKAEGATLETLNFIFGTDEYLLQINQQYLQHDDYTDIITFDNSEQPKCINGDIFISYERVKDNAAERHIKPREELHRIMIHGVLHLLGYKDKTKAEKQLMRQKEAQYLIEAPKLGNVL